MTPPPHRPDLRRIGENACAEVLSTLLRLPSTVANPSAGTASPSTGDQITNSLRLTGAKLSGSVCVHIPKSFAIQAAHIITGVDHDAAESDGLLEDTVGELANMVAGRVAAGLTEAGYACSLGTPAASRDSGLPIKNQDTVEHGRTDLICDGHRLVVEIRCHYTPL